MNQEKCVHVRGGPARTGCVSIAQAELASDRIATLSIAVPSGGKVIIFRVMGVISNIPGVLALALLGVCSAWQPRCRQ